MACLFIKGPHTFRIITQDTNGGFRYSLQPGEVAAVRPCKFSKDEASDLESIFTSDGLMLGNLVKKVTTALHLKHCLRCTGRQIRLNQRGLELQKKWLG